MKVEVSNKTIKEVMAKDAKEWGDALNSAGWEYLDAYRKITGKAESVEVFNNGKAILREAILKYIEKLEI